MATFLTLINKDNSHQNRVVALTYLYETISLAFCPLLLSVHAQLNILQHARVDPPAAHAKIDLPEGVET